MFGFLRRRKEKKRLEQEQLAAEQAKQNAAQSLPEPQEPAATSDEKTPATAPSDADTPTAKPAQADDSTATTEHAAFEAPAQSQPNLADEPDSAIKTDALGESPASEATAQDTAAEDDTAPTKTSMAVVDKPTELTSQYDQSLREPLKRTRRGLTRGLGDLFLGRKKIDDELLEEIETRLIMADVGQNTTMALIDELTDQVERKHVNDPEHLFETLWQLMVERLERVQSQAPLVPESKSRSHVIVVCGINGGGKTTSIGKLAHRYQSAGKHVLLGAGDTFRAAAVEQLISWGERNEIRVIGEPGRGDPASVAYDAVSAANARNADICIIDTAGRLHTQSGLMDELCKLVRVIKKADAQAPDEVLLVIDASIGQNALAQARAFHQAIDVTGLIVTKLDGTAKGGIVFAIADELGLPIRFIGVGERSEDLRPFEPEPFVNALLDRQ